MQLGGPTPIGYLQSVDGGLQQVVVGGGGVLSKTCTELGLLARAGSGIRSAQDCIGKKVGVPGLGALLPVTFRQWLKLNGVDAKQLSFVEAPFPQHADLLRGGHLQQLRLNPNGVVPTLVHDGMPVIESSVINEYLDEVYPQVPLRPARAIEKAHMRAWRQYIDEVPTPSIRDPSFNTFLVPKFAQMSDEQFNAMAQSLPLRRDFYLKMGRTGFAQAEVDAALRRLRDTLERMERSLERSDWLAMTCSRWPTSA